MTTELKPLSTEEKRVRIAEACGWQIEIPEGRESEPRYWRYCPPGKRWIKNLSYSDRPGDYFADLNAMAEAEKVLTEEQWIEYACSISVWRRPISATASQRAEAFGRAMGLWV